MSVQILMFGMLACTAMAVVLIIVADSFDVENIEGIIQIVVGGFAAGFVAVVTGRKVRDGLQARNGHYFDENENKVKSVENET